MSVYLQDPDVTLYHGDALETLRELPAESVHCVATSPPFYGLRDYGTGRWEGGNPDCDHDERRRRRDAEANPGSGSGAGGMTSLRDGRPAQECKCGARRVDQQIGLEETPEQWAAKLVEVFRECRRVLRRDGTLWIECGDSYVSGQGGRQSAVGELPPSTRFDRKDAGIRREGLPTSYGERDVGPRFYPTRDTGLKPKDLLGTPWLLAFALRADGWWLRGCNIWAKPNAMPESAKDRCTTAHSYIFHFAKSARYHFDGTAISEPATWERWGDQTVPKHNGTPTASGWMDPKTKDELPVAATKAPRSVWTIPTQGYPDAHFATWPEALARRIILAAVPEGGTVLDPFAGSGTTLHVARKHGRHAIGIELNLSYCEMAAKRLQQLSLLA